MAAKSKGVGLIVCTISFQNFQSESTNVTDGQTDGRTDGRHAIPIPRICTKVHCAVKSTSQVRLSGNVVQVFGIASLQSLGTIDVESILLSIDLSANSDPQADILKWGRGLSLPLLPHPIPSQTLLPFPSALTPFHPLPVLPLSSPYFSRFSFPSSPSLEVGPLNRGLYKAPV